MKASKELKNLRKLQNHLKKVNRRVAKTDKFFTKTLNKNKF